MIINTSIQLSDIASCMFYHIYSHMYCQSIYKVNGPFAKYEKSHLRFNLEFPPERDSGLLCPE